MNILKNAIESENLSLLPVTFGITKICTPDTQSVKIWWRYNTSDMNARHLCLKVPKECNKIKEPSINCSYIWHIDTLKYVYWLDTHSVKVWCSYVLSNTNPIHFCNIFLDIGHCFRTAQTKSIKNQKSDHFKLI